MKNLPDKIYIQPDAHDRWFEGKIPSGLPNGLFVEYTRTDAFVEKATKWIELSLKYYSEGGKLISTDKMIEDFRTYMEGE